MSRSSLAIWWIAALLVYVVAYATFEVTGRLAFSQGPWPIATGIGAGLLVIGLLAVVRVVLVRRGAPKLTDQTNQGNSTHAAWIIRHGQDTERVDKITPDGLVCGFSGRRGSEYQQEYGLQIGPERATNLLNIFEQLTREAASRYKAADSEQTHVLEFRFRNRDDDRRVRLEGVHHPELFDLCRQVWSLHPEIEQNRGLSSIESLAAHDAPDVERW